MSLSKKKLNLSRFKKTLKGMNRFAQLLECASPKTRDGFLKQASLDDQSFINDVMKKVVFFEELLYLGDDVVAEILANTPAKILAYALSDMPESFRKQIEKLLGFRDLRKVQDEMERLEMGKSTRFTYGAKKQIIKIARRLEAQDKFVMELENCPRLLKVSKRKVA